jgi:hypothetical protein
MKLSETISSCYLTLTVYSTMVQAVTTTPYYPTLVTHGRKTFITVGTGGHLLDYD